MHQDYTKICRVCMSDGSRDIFLKPNADGATTTATGTSGGPKIASPLERLLEKLRYVTMMKIEENDDLPRLLCDLCIVQLNVAYNFKRQAVENDTKLRQYFIENGISSNQSALVNEPPSLRNSFASSNHPQQHQRFPIVPLIVKTEPSDVDAFSDITTETNVELDNRNRFQPVTSSTSNSSPEDSIRHANNNSSKSSMVYVNSGYEFNSVTPSSDIEFVQNYQTNSARIRTNSAQRKSTTPQRSEATNNSEKSISRKSKIKPSERILNRRENTMRKVKTNADNSTKRKNRTEIQNLSIDMVPTSVKAAVPKEHRRTLGKTTRVRPQPSKPPAALSTTEPLIPLDQIKTSDSPIPTTTINRKQSATLNALNNSIPPKSTPTKKSLLASTKPNSVPNSKSSSSARAKKAADKLIVLNPFTSPPKSTPTNSKTKSVKSTANGTKRKSVEKLLRPKIEPPSSGKKNLKLHKFQTTTASG